MHIPAGLGGESMSCEVVAVGQDEDELVEPSMLQALASRHVCAYLCSVFRSFSINYINASSMFVKLPYIIIYI